MLVTRSTLLSLKRPCEDAFTLRRSAGLWSLSDLVGQPLHGCGGDKGTRQPPGALGKQVESKHPRTVGGQRGTL